MDIFENLDKEKENLLKELLSDIFFKSLNEKEVKDILNILQIGFFDIYQKIKESIEKITFYTDLEDKVKLIKNDAILYNLLKDLKEVKVYSLIENFELVFYRNLNCFLVDKEKRISLKLPLSFDKLSKAHVKALANIYGLNFSDAEVELFKKILNEWLEKGKFRISPFENERQELSFKLFLDLLIKTKEIILLSSLDEISILYDLGVSVDNYIYLIKNSLYISLGLIRSQSIDYRILYFALQCLGIQNNSIRYEIKRNGEKIRFTFWIFNYLKLKNELNVLKDVNVIKLEDFVNEIKERRKEYESELNVFESDGDNNNEF